jgi:NADH pyrophosphatase NudC (nudix superfamily)
MVEAMGYPPLINFCPRCGSGNIDSNDQWHEDGKMKCHSCGLVCFIVEGDESEEKK